MNHNTGMTTLGKVAERCSVLASGCYDEFVPLSDISFPNGLNTVSIAGERRPLLEQAQRQLANRFCIPFSYLRKCPSDLQIENLSYWKTKERNEKLFFRFNGAHVRAIFTPRYQPVNDLQIIERLFDLGYDHHTPVQARLDGNFMSIAIPDSKMTFDLDDNGDRVKPGLCFANSEVGLSSVFVTAFMLRLVCTNGMLAKTSASTSKRHISVKILDDFPLMTEIASMHLAAMTHQFQISMLSPVEDTEATFNSINRLHSVGEVETKAVEWGFHQEPGNSMFSIIQAYTRAPQFPGLSAFSMHKLERVGGQILSTVRRETA